jgi:hypothetical protein
MVERREHSPGFVAADSLNYFDLEDPASLARIADPMTGLSSRRGGFAMSDLTGKPAVPFRLRDSEGRIHRLEEYRGSWLLMVFHRHLG